MSSETAVRIAAFLDANHVVSLATCGTGGPHAASVFYVRDGLDLLWVSDPKSRHSAEIEANALVAATVAPDCFDFDDIRGVQISGQAHVIADASERANARLSLEARYPCLKRLSEGAPALQDAYQRAQFYRLEPTRLVLIDNSRGFGHKDTLELGENLTDNRREASNPSISAGPVVPPIRHQIFTI
jgi:uncharacterized protein YhbP (UPF0306 family)